MITPNNYYNITFYVSGGSDYYYGMMGSLYNVIYIGNPPSNGLCSISPLEGYALDTKFTLTQSGWRDPDGISQYTFEYSLDDGVTFLPI